MLNLKIAYIDSTKRCCLVSIRRAKVAKEIKTGETSKKTDKEVKREVKQDLYQGQPNGKSRLYFEIGVIVFIIFFVIALFFDAKNSIKENRVIIDSNIEQNNNEMTINHELAEKFKSMFLFVGSAFGHLSNYVSKDNERHERVIHTLKQHERKLNKLLANKKPMKKIAKKITKKIAKRKAKKRVKVKELREIRRFNYKSKNTKKDKIETTVMARRSYRQIFKEYNKNIQDQLQR